MGFTGSDNQGLEGIESYYDKTLSGTQGKILKLVDATGTDMGIEGEDYIAAKNGDDLVFNDRYDNSSNCRKIFETSMYR